VLVMTYDRERDGDPVRAAAGTGGPAPEVVRGARPGPPASIRGVAPPAPRAETVPGPVTGCPMRGDPP
jgi:hypothetical protein